jgi:hypothetical protein
MNPNPQNPSKKKPYEKPKLTTEKVFETAALACGKCQGSGPTSQLACRSLKKLS